MFDRHIHNQSPRYPQSIHSETHEHRAPTDESVKLLRELEAKAQDSVMLAIRSDDNAFKFSAAVFDDIANFNRTLRIQYSLNGDLRDLSIDLPNNTRNFEEIIMQVRESIIKSLATQMVVGAIKERALRNTL